MSKLVAAEIDAVREPHLAQRGKCRLSHLGALQAAVDACERVPESPLARYVMGLADRLVWPADGAKTRPS